MGSTICFGNHKEVLIEIAIACREMGLLESLIELPCLANILLTNTLIELRKMYSTEDTYQVYKVEIQCGDDYDEDIHECRGILKRSAIVIIFGTTLFQSRSNNGIQVHLSHGTIFNDNMPVIALIRLQMIGLLDNIAEIKFQAYTIQLTEKLCSIFNKECR